MSDAIAVALVKPAPGRTAWQRLSANRWALAGLYVLAAFLTAALIAPMLPLPDPDVTDTAARLQPILSPGHAMGTDGLGRDMLVRVLAGTRTSVLVGLVATSIAACIGSLAGLLAGFAGGWIDGMLMRLIDVLMAFPYVLLALAIVAALGPSLIHALYAIAIVNIPFFARNTRGVTLSLRHQPFVDAARLSGKSPVAVLFTEILPNVLPVIVVTTSTTVGWMILETAGLSFLGLGAQPPLADLGSMLGEARAVLFVAPHASIVPGLMIFVLVMCINLVGDGVRDSLDPRLRAGVLEKSAAITRDDRLPVVPPSEPPTALLDVRNLSVSIRSGADRLPVVTDVSFFVEKGQCLGLMGESGSGKSVTALSLLGLLASPPGVITGGAVYLDGRDVLSLSIDDIIAIRGRRVAYVFQDPLTTLHPMLTIGQQIVEAIRAHRPMPYAQALARAVDLLETVGIRYAQDRVHAHPNQLSGGQRQRVGIAIALARDPDLLIADEPTTALDATVQAKVLDLLQKLRRERGLALLLISHNFGVVAAMCDRVAIMRNGKIVETGRTPDILANPKHPYTKRLIACVPELGRGRGFLDDVGALFPGPQP